MSVYRSPLSSLCVHRSGWCELPSGAAITKLPIWDSDADLFARLGPGPMSRWLTERSWRLPTVAELDELQALALHIEPVVLPTAQMLIDAQLPKPWVDAEGRDSLALAAYRGAHMSSRAWCELHDAEVLRRLTQAGWVDSPVANAGKHWAVAHTLYGWWRVGQRMIQPPYSGHGLEHTDYASTSHVVQLSGSSDTVPWHDGSDLATLTRGERCVQWLGYEYGLDVHEIPGPEHDPRILSYSAHCRRGGVFLGVQSDGTPRWKGGVLLALCSDDSASPWCAAVASETLRCASLPDDPSPPHGLRVSVRELCTDARLADTLRPVGWTPTVGSLAILARAGHDPLTGGLGHVRCVIQVDGNRYLGLGGNESDAITCAWHSLSSPSLRGWIER